jgi:hypothetical protein
MRRRFLKFFFFGPVEIPGISTARPSRAGPVPPSQWWVCALVVSTGHRTKGKALWLSMELFLVKAK